jgi:hypothetical protein
VDDRKNDFEDISKLIKAELDRFDKEKVEDFKNSVEAFLESMVQTQKEVSKILTCLIYDWSLYVCISNYPIYSDY